MARFKVFVSFCHKDRRWLDSLCGHLGVLEREGLIDVFADTRIGPGADWLSTLDREMQTARLALLLISASFLTSDFIREAEVPRLLLRHADEGMTIYPLLVRDCAWEQVGWLERIQMRPSDARPVESMRGAAREACLASVAREVASIVKADDRRSTPSPDHHGSRLDDARLSLAPGDVEVLRQIALARGQRTSAGLLGERLGARRCEAALASLEREGLVRSFTMARGKRFAVTELGRQMLARKGLL